MGVVGRSTVMVSRRPSSAAKGLSAEVRKPGSATGSSALAAFFFSSSAILRRRGSRFAAQSNSARGESLERSLSRPLLARAAASASLLATLITLRAVTAA